MNGNVGPGFNVIAHLNSTSGLGNAARLFIDVLKKAGFGVAGFNVEYSPGEAPRALDGLTVFDRVDDLPYDCNIVIVAAQLLPSLWLRRAPGLTASRFKNACLFFWELSTLPQAWVPTVAMFDVILVCSPFVRQAIEHSLPDLPTMLVEHPLLQDFTPRAKEDVRQELGLSERIFVCACSFDLRSDIARKNPRATFDAFQRAFEGDTDVRLLVKTNRVVREALPQAAQELLSDMERDPRVIIISETLTYENVLSLYAASDVYVSLHRSEGLGLGPMEAMLLGKLVISTGYSGNMAYMTNVNSRPIPYFLVEPKGTVWQYLQEFSGEHAYWADADIGEAAGALRWSKECPEEREVFAARGRRDIEERQCEAWSGKYAHRLLHLLEGSTRGESRKRHRNAIRNNEFLDPTLRKLNLRNVLGRMNGWRR
jgi:glycosyltransferase involved in cell wall biosynthesis